MAFTTRAEVFKGRNGKWFFHFKARNGRIIVQSQGYKRKFDAMRGARRALDAREEFHIELDM